jgi:transcriptional regulator with XRE-family HTH domain
MADDEELLTAVGPRLRTVRQERGATLAQLAATTGISVSTLSRLEAGERRPTLELLLPLARAHQLPLDELIGTRAPEDPRVHPHPVRRNGVTMYPLTRRPGGIQAYKMIVSPARVLGEQKSHEGYEWVYVLAGELRLRLGELDLVLKAGEVAEFDTHTPHSFGSASARPVEVLALFGPRANGCTCAPGRFVPNQWRRSRHVRQAEPVLLLSCSPIGITTTLDNAEVLVR